jgi:hypothetical protein
MVSSSSKPSSSGNRRFAPTEDKKWLNSMHLDREELVFMKACSLNFKSQANWGSAVRLCPVPAGVDGRSG